MRRKPVDIMLLVLLGTSTLAKSQPNETVNQDYLPKLKHFEEYAKRTSLYHHFKSLKKSNGAATRRSSTKTIMEVIDNADELLALDIEEIPVDEEVTNASRRFFEPAGRIVTDKQIAADAFGLKGRLYELMKQTIYEVRDNIMIIQDLREKYKWHSLYKMGTLFSKTDATLKLFTQLSHKYYSQCRKARGTLGTRNWYKFNPTQMGEMIERILNHWFEVDLLHDVIRVNYDETMRTLNYMTDLNELDNWFVDKFDDVFFIQNKIKATQQKKRREKKERKERRERERLAALEGEKSSVEEEEEEVKDANKKEGGN